MDVQMPEMNGFEATRMIRDPNSRVLRHDIPIIAMTAHALKGDRDRCLEAGMNDYISKPVTTEALDDILEKRLGPYGSEGPAVPAPASTPFAPVNLQRIKDITDGDLAFEQELIESFLSDTERHVADLESAVEETDGERLKLQAHAIKGSGANAGAGRLAEIAGRLEQVRIGSESEKARELLDDLRSEFERVREYLQAQRNPQQRPMAATASS
jgi:CheY-like chemotaxis protein